LVEGRGWAKKKRRETMDKKELLMKTKLEFRAFEVLLERYNDPILAYEAWKKEAQFDISEILKKLIFEEKLSVLELEEKIRKFCKLIDEDLWWIESYPLFEEYIDKMIECK
jgi:hypothetical protein